MHCYVLGEAQRQGLLHVEGMYESPVGELYVYLRQSEPVSDSLDEFFKAKAHEYMGSYPEIVTQEKGYVIDTWCGLPPASQPDSGYRDCVVRETFLGRNALPSGLYAIVPWTSRYGYVKLGLGGAAGRRVEPGWASWTQLWPAVEVVGGVGGASGSSGASGGGFDVSDVDVTNFPELDCREAWPYNLTTRNSCHAWKDYPELGVAGRRWDEDKRITYVQIKSPIPRDEAGLNALRGRIFPRYRALDWRVEFIPVKYDFGELWRWSVVLDRFAVSRGNTVGIISARVGENRRYRDDDVFPLASLRSGESPAEMRETIKIWALDTQRVEDALPALLPRLGIPVDAVGVLRRAIRGPLVIIAEPGGSGAISGDGAATPTATSTPASLAPYDDCWGGTLSGEPLACYALGEAQRQGLLRVEGVYESTAARELHVYLRQSEPVSDSVDAFLEAKAYEYMIARPDLVEEDEEYVGGWCNHKSSEGGAAYLECISKETFAGYGGAPTWHYVIRPWPSRYDYVKLGLGGADGRRVEPGWASWTQLWPANAAVGGVGGASGSSGASGDGFDVSDVDVTNFPELDCDEEWPDGYLTIYNSCATWSDHPGLGIAGRRWDEDKRITYVQMKSPVPRDEAGLNALRGRIFPRHRALDWKVEFIPVKYDFGELWRWSVILDRFAVSAGNTVGITGAGVWENRRHSEDDVFRLASLGPGESPSEMRETIWVWGFDQERIVDALPVLLPQLGIPVDAVGVVDRDDGTPVIPAGRRG